MTILLEGAKTLTGRPSLTFTAQKIAEMALQKIGAFSVNDTGADPVELERTLTWMETIIAEKSETEECWWLRPATLSQTLTDGEAEYKVTELDEYPALGIVYITGAFLRDASGNDGPLEIYRRSQYEAIEDKAAGGEPVGIYVDRTGKEAIIRPWPVPDSDDLSLRMTVQTFSPSVLGNAEKGTASGDTHHGFGAGWQRWLITATAAEIADGPVRKLDGATVREWRTLAGGMYGELFRFANREKNTKRRTAAWGQ